MADIKKFVEEVKGLTVLELNELVKALEEEFGVSAAAAMVVAGGAGAGAAAPAAEEKTEFDVVIKEVPADKKIAVIKAIREITGLGLVEAKAMAEKLPSTLKEAQPKELADQMAEKLKAAGATVELK